MKITHEQKELALEALRVEGTMQAAAKAARITVRTLNNEMNRSAIFKKRVLDAREEGKRNMADNAIDRIKEYAFNPPEKTDRNVLTAAIALANAFEPGFRGTTTVQGRIAHDVRVITAVPRPKYDELPEPKITIDNPPKKMLKSKRVGIHDEKGNLIAIKHETVEEAIEGEAINNE